MPEKLVEESLNDFFDQNQHSLISHRGFIILVLILTITCVVVTCVIVMMMLGSQQVSILISHQYLGANSNGQLGTL